MDVRVLGPVELAGDDGAAICIGSAKRRAVLAVLALDLERVVSVQHLLDLVWGEYPPACVRTALHGHVSALRKSFGSRLRLETRDRGYVLHGDPDLVDVHRFERLVARSAGERDVAAAGTLREALSLWRGPALADLACVEAREALTSQLERARRVALELLSERLLRLGRGGQAIASLSEAVRASPLHEPLVRALLLCLYQDGRQAEALEVYHHARIHLAEQLGISPGSALQVAYETVLRADPPPVVLVAGAEDVASTEDALDGADQDDELSGTKPEQPVSAPAQLPRDLANFTGRQHELRLLDEHRAACGLTLVVGPPGVGKTALTMHWAHRVADQFPDGSLYADLHGYERAAPTDVASVLNGFLRCLGVRDAAIPSQFEAQVALYRTLLAGKRVLIVIDNVRSADLVRPLLPAGRDSAVVVTSRHRLDGFIAREGAAVIALASLPTVEAIELLASVIGTGRVEAEPDAARRIADLCDELPLALRIAAARLVTNPTQTLSALAEELADEGRRLGALTTDDETWSVEAALSLSYQTLSESVAELFRYIGLLPAPQIDVPTAAALVGGTHHATRRLLTSLVVANLVEQPVLGRYGRHDLVRLYSSGLAAHHISEEEREHSVGRLLDYFLDATAGVYRTLGTLSEPHHTSGAASCRTAHPASSAQALEWFDANEANLRAALNLGMTYEQHELVWKIIDNVSVPYARRGNYHTLVSVVAIGRRAARLAGDEYGEMRMLRRLGSTFAELGRPEEASDYLHQALPLAARFADDQQRCAILDRLAMCERAKNQWRRALDYYEEALKISRNLGDPRREAILLNNLADALVREGRPDEALDYVQQALDRVADLPADSAYVAALHTRGSALDGLGRTAEAFASHGAALTVAQRLGDLRAEAPCLQSLGEMLLRAGRTAEARTHLGRAAELYGQLSRPEAHDVLAVLRELADFND